MSSAQSDEQAGSRAESSADTSVSARRLDGVTLTLAEARKVAQDAATRAQEARDLLAQAEAAEQTRLESMTTDTVTLSTEVASEALAILLGAGTWTLTRTTDGGLSLNGPDDLTMTRAEVLAVRSLRNCGWRLDMDLQRVQALVWVRRTDI